jgi:hypothetical protein
MKFPFLAPKPKPTPDATEEHHIVLPGLDIAFNHTTRTVFIVDQTGGTDAVALQELENWLSAQGYFLHGVSVLPEKPKE